MTISCAAAAVCTILQGSPVVVDGDTLRFDKQYVRLFGIDAEERRETHGPRATEGLRALVTSTPYVRCHLNGDTTHRRSVGSCYTSDGRDLAALLVSQGLVLDCARYSKGAYRHLEPAGARDRLAQKPYCNWRGNK